MYFKYILVYFIFHYLHIQSDLHCIQAKRLAWESKPITLALFEPYLS